MGATVAVERINLFLSAYRESLRRGGVARTTTIFQLVIEAFRGPFQANASPQRKKFNIGLSHDGNRIGQVGTEQQDDE